MNAIPLNSTSLAIFVLWGLLTPSLLTAQNTSGEPVQAPENPAFLNYLDQVQRGTRAPLEIVNRHYLGLIPKPIDFSYLKSQPRRLTLAPEQLPTSYDLRNSGRMTPVKDQGACGDCWAFATYGSMESVLEPAETWQFSENNLKNLSGFDWAPCQGGNGLMSIAYLARWAGPVNASADPYQPTDTNTSPPGLPPQKHVQNVIIIPGRSGPLDNNALKNAIITYGAIQTSIYMDENNYYYPSTASNYYNGASNVATNHGVTLAGWNDNCSASNFLHSLPGNGAFLIKNSWGTSFGQSGYFWISYYDAVYAYTQSYVYVENEALTNYTREYEYDRLGWIRSYGYTGSTPNTGWFADVFTSVAAEQLRAVSFYAASNNSAYTAKIYTNATSGPTSGTLAATLQRRRDLRGLHHSDFANSCVANERDEVLNSGGVDHARRQLSDPN